MLDLTLFENPFENVFVLTKWDWDYLEAEKFQLECVDFVHQNPHLRIFLICSHPHCFTMGRGLQKQKDLSQLLVEFDVQTNLPFPLHNIKRGGGLTFHYPGQFIFYPIVNVTHHKWAIFDLMIEILGVTKNILANHFSLNGLNIKKDLLGLWYEEEFTKGKVASIGLAASRFNTYHGLALNFFHDQDMFDALKQVYPCGLPGDIYRNLENLFANPVSLNDRVEFANLFIQLFYESLNSKNHLIIERQRSSSLIIDSISL